MCSVSVWQSGSLEESRGRLQSRRKLIEDRSQRKRQHLATVCYALLRD